MAEGGHDDVTKRSNGDFASGSFSRAPLRAGRNIHIQLGRRHIDAPESDVPVRRHERKFPGRRRNQDKFAELGSGEFLWSGLPPNNFVLHPISAPVGHVNLYTLTANDRYGFDRIHGSRYGMYVIGGGGWYYRYASVDKNYVAPTNTVCQPIYG